MFRLLVQAFPDRVDKQVAVSMIVNICLQINSISQALRKGMIDWPIGVEWFFNIDIHTDLTGDEIVHDTTYPPNVSFWAVEACYPALFPVGVVLL